jgi:hypothetical protein
MRIASGTIGAFVAIVGTMIASSVPAHAQTCGDANRSGSITVTDGVLVLRAAAELPSNCPRERCDMNVDGRISVTDGVLALRLAAGVQAQVACSASQAGTLFGQIVKTLSFASTASPAARARAAQTTTPCSGGGFTDDNGFTITFFDCREDDFVTNGSLTISVTGSDNLSLFFETSDLVVSTGEIIETVGTLDFAFSDVTQVDGTLSHSSTILGEYTDEFSEVLLDGDFVAFSGQVTTTITQGSDIFANVSVLVATIFSPTLAQIGVTYADGDFDVFTLADGLCEPCSSRCDNASLTCVSCVDGCTNDSDRCGIDFDVLDCDDGLFGPSGLCVPCRADTDCDESEGLSCFSCGKNCTGSITRCGSSKAYVECVDGAF